MKKPFLFLVVMALALLSSCFLPRVPKTDIVYKTDSLIIEKIAENVYVHISFINVTNYGPFPCNGMVVVDENEAFIFDTPTTDAVTEELLSWVATDLKKETMGLVVHHFHEDCTGGLRTFIKKGIPSYGSQRTIDQLIELGEQIPSDAFKDQLELRVGNLPFTVKYFGEGHTKDNVVSYFPQKELLFGGCLVKEVGAGKGNLADANTQVWPTTIEVIQTSYPNLKLIVPGHGKVGGLELLDYTKGLFENK